MKLSIKFLSLLILILLINLNIKAEIVEKIIISGNERVSDETVKIYGGIKIKSDLQENDLNLILKNLYSTNFFEDVTVNLNNSTLSINLKEYPIINQLVIVGEKSKRIRERIKDLISLKEKKSFIKSNLNNDLNLIKKIYSTFGYNNAQIEIKQKIVNKNNLDLLIQIDKGQETIIRSIKFIGDKKIRERRLKDIIASEENKFWKFISKNTKFSEQLLNLDIRLLNNYYKSIGYYDVNIVSKSAIIYDEGYVDLIYSIDAGKRYRINKIYISADPIYDKDTFVQLESNFKDYIGKYYSPFSVKKLLDSIDELISDKNLQFVEHNVEEKVNEKSSEIEIKFNIYESEKTSVERINIVGNNVTNEDVIRGELIIDEGDPFSKINLDKSVSKIKARNIFRNVNSSVSEGSNSSLKVIDITVEEKPTGEISAGAGVGTNGGTFAINISENNWLGEGKKLNFEIEVDEESLGGNINYTDPNYNFFGNSINYFIGSTSNDKPTQGFENTTLSTGINTSFEQYKDVFARLGVAFTYDDLRTQNTASSSLKKQSGEFSELLGTYGFKYDRRDRAFMPTSGSIIIFDQSLPFFADKKSLGNILSISNYKALSQDVIGASKIYISTITGIGDDDVRISKRTNLSTNRLRGFQRGKVGPIDGDDHIGGNYAAVLNLEANLPNLLPESTNTEVGLFLDIGNVWGVDYDSTIDESNKLRSSAGIAASWSSPLGPMTFNLSTNLSKADTDKTESFSFNLGTTF